MWEKGNNYTAEKEYVKILMCKAKRGYRVYQPSRDFSRDNCVESHCGIPDIPLCLCVVGALASARPGCAHLVDGAVPGRSCACRNARGPRRPRRRRRGRATVPGRGWPSGSFRYPPSQAWIKAKQMASKTTPGITLLQPGSATSPTTMATKTSKSNTPVSNTACAPPLAESPAAAPG